MKVNARAAVAVVAAVAAATTLATPPPHLQFHFIRLVCVLQLILFLYVFAEKALRGLKRWKEKEKGTFRSKSNPFEFVFATLIKRSARKSLRVE